MKLLLTNDDGIDAPGLAALGEVAAQLGTPVVVAPADAQSGCGHRVTTSRPIKLGERGPARFVVDALPADCVRVGLDRLLPDAAWVLAGINHGGNLGADIYHSGTVAAVREAVLHGRPGVAVSHYCKKGMALDWQQAAAWLLPVLRDLLSLPCPAGTFWNVNLPHLPPGAAPPEAVVCPLDPSPLPLRFRQEGELLHYDGDYHQRRRQPGSDVDVCFGGRIAVTEVRLV
jgi:5'-nucleotidase